MMLLVLKCPTPSPQQPPELLISGRTFPDFYISYTLFPFSLVICGAPVSVRKMEKKKQRRQKRTKMKTIWWEVEAGRRKMTTGER